MVGKYVCIATQFLTACPYLQKAKLLCATIIQPHGSNQLYKCSANFPSAVGKGLLKKKQNKNPFLVYSQTTSSDNLKTVHEIECTAFDNTHYYIIPIKYRNIPFHKPTTIFFKTANS